MRCSESLDSRAGDFATLLGINSRASSLPAPLHSLGRLSTKDCCNRCADLRDAASESSASPVITTGCGEQFMRILNPRILRRVQFLQIETGSAYLFAAPLAQKQNPDVHHVGLSEPRLKEIAGRLEKMIGVVAVEEF